MAFLDLNGLTAFKGKVDEQSVIEYTCVTTGTVHALTSSYTSNNIKFVLDSAFNTGDTFTVNGTAVTAKMQSGGDIKPNSLSVGVMAFAILSGTTLVFVGGGSSEVESVFGRTGNIVADKTDYQDYYLQAKLEDATDVPEVPNFAVPDGITIQQSTAGVWKATNNMLRKGTDSTDGGIIAIPIDAGTLDGNDSEYFAKSDAIGAVSDLTTTAKTVVPAVNELNQNLTGLKSKLLWTGNFTSGSVEVPELSNYALIMVSVGGAPCIGNANYGGTLYGAYGTYAINQMSYRFAASGNTLTIDANNKGGTDGTGQQPITAIHGLIRV